MHGLCAIIETIPVKRLQDKNPSKAMPHVWMTAITAQAQACQVHREEEVRVNHQPGD